jgi:hypothetical protein
VLVKGIVDEYGGRLCIPVCVPVANLMQFSESLLEDISNK